MWVPQHEDPNPAQSIEQTAYQAQYSDSWTVLLTMIGTSVDGVFSFLPPVLTVRVMVFGFRTLVTTQFSIGPVPTLSMLTW
jgi:hypothetical protein